MKMQIKDYFIGTIDAIALDEKNEKINENNDEKMFQKNIDA